MPVFRSEWNTGEVAGGNSPGPPGRGGCCGVPGGGAGGSCAGSAAASTAAACKRATARCARAASTSGRYAPVLGHGAFCVFHDRRQKYMSCPHSRAVRKHARRARLASHPRHVTACSRAIWERIADDTRLPQSGRHDALHKRAMLLWSLEGSARMETAHNDSA